MKITLIRHGKPIQPPARWLAPCDMPQWIAAYDRSDVDPAVIPAASIQACSDATVIFASTLARAQSSARALGHAAPRTDALFCEAALPCSRWRFPRLPAPLWAALLHAAWLLGYARGADSLALVSARARSGAALLTTGATEGPVLLIRHGIMNRLIARELRAAGWRSNATHRSRYWSAVTFQSP